jgi:hypothetical protein
MAETAIRRRRAFLFFLAIAIASSLLMLFADPGSRARELGTILMLMWFVPATFFVFYFAKKRRLVPMPLGFDAGEPFAPHVALKLTPAAEWDIAKARAARSGHRAILVVGTQGFTARFALPAEAGLHAGVPLRVQAQFLRPEVALPHFQAGAAFTLLEGGRTVGTGTVVEVLL